MAKKHLNPPRFSWAIWKTETTSLVSHPKRFFLWLKSTSVVGELWEQQRCQQCSPKPSWRGFNIHHSLHSVCVQGCRLMCDTGAGLCLGWCLDLYLRPSRFILRWQKTHLSQAGQDYLEPSLTWLACVQRSVWETNKKKQLYFYKEATNHLETN